MVDTRLTTHGQEAHGLWLRHDRLAFARVQPRLPRRQVLLELDFPQPDGNGRHLDQFIIVQVLHGLFEGKLAWLGSVVRLHQSLRPAYWSASSPW
jgi:hypothetical protein